MQKIHAAAAVFEPNDVDAPKTTRTQVTGSARLAALVQEACTAAVALNINPAKLHTTASPTQESRTVAAAPGPNDVTPSTLHAHRSGYPPPTPARPHESPAPPPWPNPASSSSLRRQPHRHSHKRSTPVPPRLSPTMLTPSKQRTHRQPTALGQQRLRKRQTSHGGFANVRELCRRCRLRTQRRRRSQGCTHTRDQCPPQDNTWTDSTRHDHCGHRQSSHIT